MILSLTTVSRTTEYHASLREQKNIFVSKRVKISSVSDKLSTVHKVLAQLSGEFFIFLDMVNVELERNGS